MAPNLRLVDCILTVENALSVPEISRILDAYSSSARWRPATIGSGILNRSSRNCDVIDLASPLKEIVVDEPDKWTETLLRTAVQQVYLTYRSAFPKVVITRDHGYKLLRYGCGGFYEEHVDEGDATGRTLSCSIILNDDFAGGEMAWFNSTLVIPPKRGMAILFPSNFLFPHAVLPVREGTRFSVVTWLG